METFCKRTEKTKEELRSFIKENFNEIWDSYAGTIEVNNDKGLFNEMILRDACFIFELFCRDFEGKIEEDYILKTPWLKNTIKLDLILLENQLPFFFLEKLFDFAKPKIDIESENTFEHPKHPSDNYFGDHLFKGIVSCLNVFSSSFSTWGRGDLSEHLMQNPEEKSSPAATNNKSDSLKFLKLTIDFIEDSPDEEVGEIKKIEHFTDLIRQSCLPKNKFEDHHCNRPQTKVVNHICSATKLERAGLNFVPAPTERPLAQVEISNGPWYKYIPWFRSQLQLELSPLKIEGNTECLLRNVIALEQCLYPRSTVICNYVALMSSLIDTAMDIDILYEKDIIVNLLGNSQEAADLVNNLCHGIVEENFIYSAQCKKLKEFNESWVNITRATLKKVYFNDLWTASSTIFGLIVLFFSIYTTIT